jgi:hypothetical protein
MKVAETKPVATPAKKTTPFFNKEGNQDFFSPGQQNNRAFFQTKNGHSPVQTKLNVGRPGDHYEREADSVADKVVQRLSTGKPEGTGKDGNTIQAKPIAPLVRVSSFVQKKCDSCEHEEKLQKKDKEDEKDSHQDKIQKKPIFESNAPPPDDDKNVQRKCATCEKEETVQKQSDSTASAGAPTSIESSLSSSKGSGTPLPSTTRRQMESSIGADFSQVRIHTGGDAEKMSADLNAHAFTHGNDIYFNSGKYDAGSASGKHLLAHELTHTVQQGASAREKDIHRKAEPDGQISSTSGEMVQGSFLDSLANAYHATVNAAGDLVDEAGNVIHMGEEFFWSMLEKLNPTAAQLVRKISEVGIIPFLKDELKKAVNFIFRGLENNTGILGQLSPVFQNLLVRARAILTALADGDCKPLFAALNELKDTLTQLAGEAWDKISAFFAPIGEFLEGVWQSIGLPVIEWIKKTAGEVWEKIESFGRDIWSLIVPVKNALAKAWDWLKGKLGLEFDETGEEGLLQWVERKAAEAWDFIKAELEPIITPVKHLIQEVRAIIPLDAILHLRETINGWLDKITSMGDAMGADGKGVGKEQEQISLRDQILPAVLKFIERLRLGVIHAGDWVAEKVGSIGTAIQGFFNSISNNALLSGLSGAIDWLRKGVDSLVSWAQNTVRSLFKTIGDGMVYLSKFIRPIFNFLEKLVGVLGDLLGKIPDLIMGPVWWVLPECLKEPIKKFFLEQILGRVPFFKQLIALGDIWVKLKNAALLALKQVFVDGNLAGAIWTFYKTMLDILKIPPQLVAGIISKGAKALKDILNAPFDFFINLLKALKGGFIRFFDNIWTHLMKGLATWITGKLEGTGVELPKEFTFKEVFKFVCSLLGITLDKILEKIEKVTGKVGLKAKLQKLIAKGSKALAWITDLFSDGIGGVWKKMQQKLGNLWEMILDGVAGWIQNNLITKALKWVAEKLDPTGIMAVITTIIDIIKEVVAFAGQARQILEIINSFLDRIGEIIKGNIEKAAEVMEGILGKAVPLAIELLAVLLDMEDIGDEVKEKIEDVRAKVDEGLDWLAEEAKSLVDSLFGSGDDDKKEDTVPEVENDLDAEDSKVASDGDINQEQAEQVAHTVYGKHSNLVKSISVVDGGNSWDYDYVQLVSHKGPVKEEGNAKYIEQFIGKDAPSDPPKGYNYYDEKDDGSFKIRRDEASEKFVKLAIQSEPVEGEDEEVGAANKIIKGEEGSNRLSKPGKLARNVGGTPKNHQFHHILPDAVVRGSELMRFAMDKLNYDLDRKENGIRMPCNDAGQKVTNLPIHNGSHTNYSTKVTRELDTIMANLMKEVDGDEEKIDKKQIDKAVRQAEDRFRTVSSESYPQLK